MPKSLFFNKTIKKHSLSLAFIILFSKQERIGFVRLLAVRAGAKKKLHLRGYIPPSLMLEW